MSSNFPLDPDYLPEHDQLRGINPNAHHDAFTEVDHAQVNHKGLPGVPIIDDSSSSNDRIWSADKLLSMFVKLSTANQANGYAKLGTDGKLPLGIFKSFLSGISADTVDGCHASCFERVSHKNRPYGYAGLDSSGKVPNSLLYSSGGGIVAHQYNNNNGWIKFQDLIIQYGYSYYVPYDSSRDYSFPISFPTKCIVGISSHTRVQVQNDSGDGFVILDKTMFRLWNGANGEGAYSLNWIALGY